MNNQPKGAGPDVPIAYELQSALTDANDERHRLEMQIDQLEAQLAAVTAELSRHKDELARLESLLKK